MNYEQKWGDFVYIQRDVEDKDTFAKNWDRIFGKRKQKHPTDEDLAAYDEERLVSKYDKESGEE